MFDITDENNYQGLLSGWSIIQIIIPGKPLYQWFQTFDQLILYFEMLGCTLRVS